MTEDGVLGVVQARLEDVADDVLEGLGVVDPGEVDDGLVGGGLARHLTDELLGLGIEGGTGLHLGDLAEKTDDEPAHLALWLVEGTVLLQLTADAPTDGVALAIEVVGETLDGVVDEPVDSQSVIRGTRLPGVGKPAALSTPLPRMTTVRADDGSGRGTGDP